MKKRLKLKPLSNLKSVHEKKSCLCFVLAAFWKRACMFFFGTTQCHVMKLFTPPCFHDLKVYVGEFPIGDEEQDDEYAREH
jgi:hypothetical protein